MDILISSNLERLLYYGTNDSAKTKKLMEDLVKYGKYDYKNPFDFFKAYTTDEKKTVEVIKNVYDEYKYVIDPHTAVAYNAYLSYKEEHNEYKTVILSTASPFKFPNVVLEAFNIVAEDPISMLNEKFNLQIPKVLNYPPVVREVVDLKDAEGYIVDVIKCF